LIQYDCVSVTRYGELFRLQIFPSRSIFTICSKSSRPSCHSQSPQGAEARGKLRGVCDNYGFHADTNHSTPLEQHFAFYINVFADRDVGVSPYIRPRCGTLSAALLPLPNAAGCKLNVLLLSSASFFSTACRAFQTISSPSSHPPELSEYRSLALR
jgi:hypothetical protein